MSEEEEKALETIKEELQDQKQAFKHYKGVLGVYSNGKVEILLNLVNKQQKEIEELKKDKKDNIQVIYGGRRFGTEGMVVKDYINKDKIREVIEELEIKRKKYYNKNLSKAQFAKSMKMWGAICYMKELLGENIDE